jgi:predicted permease
VVGSVLVGFGLLEPSIVPIMVVLSGMPAALTTFALALDAGVGTERVATVIVGSTLLSLASLPVLSGLALWWPSP